MALDLIAVIVGIVYGYVRPGKEDRIGLLKTGARYGVILGVI